MIALHLITLTIKTPWSPRVIVSHAAKGIILTITSQEELKVVVICSDNVFVIQCFVNINKTVLDI